MLTADDAAALDRCMEAGGIALIPTDTVYGLACDPSAPEGAARLASIKARDPQKPCAVLFSQVDLAFAAMPWLEPETAEAIERLLPGAVTVLVPNPLLRFRFACGALPQVLGVRVPDWPEPAAALEQLAWPVMQTSANPAGDRAPARVEEVDAQIAAACDQILDAGPLPGEASTVVDLTSFGSDGSWTIVREGAVSRAALERALER